jgi:transcriptional regulator with XRE-family HTH domain
MEGAFFLAKEFKDLLAEAIEWRGVSQKWLSIEARTTEASISRYLSGQHTPGSDMIARIATALSIHADFLLGLNPMILPDDKWSTDEQILVAVYRKSSPENREYVWHLLKRYADAREIAYLKAHNLLG